MTAVLPAPSFNADPDIPTSGPVAVKKRLDLIGGLVRGIPHDLTTEALVWRDPDSGVIRHHTMGAATVTLGRAVTNDIVLRVKSVSREHAIIRSWCGEFVLSDLNSSNGTWVNGTRIESRLLGDGILIELGNFPLVFCHPVRLRDYSAPSS